MSSGLTNKGARRLLGAYFLEETPPANFYVRLVTSATAPTADTNTASQLTEIAAGNGYTAGGYEVAPGDTDFDVITEDDTNDRALVQLVDIIWTVTGGPMPPSGNGARWAVLTDDNATDGDREILDRWDLVTDRTLASGNEFTLIDLEIRLTQT